MIDRITLNLNPRLYTRAGFIPRAMYHDMVINVPAHGLDAPSVQGEDHVRKAAPHDIAQMGELECFNKDVA